MKPKRFLAVILSLILIAGSVLQPVFAAQPVKEAVPSALSVSQDSAATKSAQVLDGAAQQEILARIIPLVKSRVQVSERLSEFSSSLNIGEMTTVDLRWSLPEGSDGYETMQVTCDLGGHIQSYYHYAGNFYYSNFDYLPRIAKISREEAADIAAKFVARLCPDVVDQLGDEPQITNPLDYTGSYSFFFPRQIDGITVQNQGITVYYDNSQGMVTSLSRNWNDNLGAVQESKGVISAEQAKESFAKYVGLELAYTATNSSPYQEYSYAYRSYYGVNVNSEPYLVYRLPKSAYAVFDAFSGEPADAGFGFTSSIGYGYSFDYAFNTASGELRAEEQLAVDQMKDLLGSEQLQEIVTGIDELYFDQGAKMESLRYSKNSAGKYVAAISWTVALSEDDLVAHGISEGQAKEYAYYGYNTYISAELDAQTGELLRYDRYVNLPYRDSSDPQECLSDVELHAQAEQFLKKVKPEQYAQSRYVSEQNNLSAARSERVVYQGEATRFTWIRQANGLDFDIHNLNIALDPLSGKVTSFYQNWAEVQFPKVEGIISKEEAEAIFLKTVEPKLVYQLENKPYAEKADARLVYTNEAFSQVVVDAKKSLLLSASEGTAYRAPGEPHYRDMVGHPAQEKVELLADMGILINGSATFNPAATVTQGDYLKDLLVLTERYYSPRSTSQLYSSMLSQRIIDAVEYQADAVIGSGTALKYLLRKANHREVAEMTGVFTVPGHIPADLAGYAALGSAYGLLNLQTWQANKPLTRLEQAELFYAFLTRP